MWQRKRNPVEHERDFESALTHLQERPKRFPAHGLEKSASFFHLDTHFALTIFAPKDLAKSGMKPS